MDKLKVFKSREKIIKSMAHASRLIIIDALSKKEKCVCELVALIGADASTVSKHLSILKNSGIIEDEKRAQKVFYRLRCPCVLKYIDCIEGIIKNEY